MGDHAIDSDIQLVLKIFDAAEHLKMLPHSQAVKQPILLGAHSDELAEVVCPPEGLNMPTRPLD